MTDCYNKERQRSKTVFALCDGDDVLKLGYTSVVFLDLGVKVDGTYYCDLLLSNNCCLPYVLSLATLYFRKQCHNI